MLEAHGYKLPYVNPVGGVRHDPGPIAVTFQRRESYVIRRFKIDRAVAVTGEGYYYDLHNFYNFRGVRLDTIECRLEVVFEKSVGPWMRPDDPGLIIISFIGLVHIEASSGIFDCGSIEDLDEIGYKSPGDIDDTSLLSEAQSTPADQIYFRFGPDEYLRVDSDLAEVNAHSGVHGLV